MYYFRIVLVSQLVALSFLSCSSFAQGTAGSPSTAHFINPATQIAWIGGPNDTVNGPGPIPIDLDASGGPWRKSILADPVFGFGGGNLAFRETIVNAGTEPWTDWHEVILNNGTHFGAWGTVTDIRINGTSITFSATSTSGNQIVDLDNFSQPVLPGDVFEIDKQFGPLTDNFAIPGALVVTLLQYPTSMIIPEPTSMVLSTLGLLVASGMRRRNRT